MSKPSKIPSMKENYDREKANKMFEYSGITPPLDDRALQVLGSSSFAKDVLREEGFSVSETKIGKEEKKGNYLTHGKPA
jgi:hypothetical protein